jgi:hypothetical protein
MGATYPNALANARNYINQHISIARQLNKPLTMEEFGLPRDNMKYNPGSAATYRDNYYAALLKLIYDSSAAGAPIAGSNFWGWGGEGRSPNSDFTWRTGNPFVCDPPMEKQGLNSVFDVDSSTIKVLKDHSLQMASLRESTAITNNEIVSDFKLYQNYPNPFNPTTNIKFSIPTLPTGQAGSPINPSPYQGEGLGERWITLKVYDVLGNEIAILVSEEKPAGKYEVTFSGSELSSGVYYYRLRGGNYVENKKMILLK